MIANRAGCESAASPLRCDRGHAFGRRVEWPAMPNNESPEEHDDHQRQRQREIAQAYSQRLWRLAGLGGTLASEILAGALLGWGLDWLLGTLPWFLIILTLGGVVIGMMGFIRAAVREQRSDSRDASSTQQSKQ